jgi:FkbM family methyltransferase
MTHRPDPAALFGLARSLLMYYAIPGRARGWRAFYSQFVHPGQLCFDLGAHVGNRAAALLAIGARVVAVEPQPLFANVLRRLHPQLIVVQAAVSSQAGAGNLLISRGTPTVSTLSADWQQEVGRSVGFRRVKWDESHLTHVTTLDALIAEHGLPVLCKIDIEGGEHDALLGLNQPIRLISFEYVPAVMDRALACIQRLEQLGDYEFNLMKSEVPRLALPAWVSAQQVRAELGRIPAEARAGEAYARLRQAQKVE